MNATPIALMEADANNAPEKMPFLTGPEFDLPVYEGKPKHTYLICSTGRSGSTLLCSLLGNTGLMGVPHEYLNFTRHAPLLAKRLLGNIGAVKMEPYMDALVRVRTSPNGVFGIKAHINQYVPHFKSGFLTRYFGDVKHILIRRGDTLGQAISLVIASQTEKWTSHEKQVREAEYSRAQIVRGLEIINEHNAAWDQYFAQSKIPYCMVYYEDLLERPTEEIQRVMEYVGVDENVAVRLEDAGLKREANAVNDEFRRLYNEGK